VSQAELARFAEVKGELDDYAEVARRAKLPAADQALRAGRDGLAEAERRRDAGDAGAGDALMHARDEVRRAVGQALASRVQELLTAARGEQADAAVLSRVEGEVARLSGAAPLEQARGLGQAIDAVQAARALRRRSDAELALGLASIRLDGAAFQPLQRRFDDAAAQATVDPAAAIAAFDDVRRELVGRPGLTPRALRQRARAGIMSITPPGYLYAICGAPGGQFAALGPGPDQEKALFVCGLRGEQVTSAQYPLPTWRGGLVSLAPAGADAFWVAVNVSKTTGEVHLLRLAGRRVVDERSFVVPGWLCDLDTAPDGTLYVATLREVRAYRDGEAIAAVNVASDFMDDERAPRRVAALARGGWAVTGLVSESSEVWGEAETKDQWRLTLRASTPGSSELQRFEPRALNLLAVAGCGDGLLAVDHRQGADRGGGDLYLYPTTFAPPKQGLVAADATRPVVGLDVAVSGRFVYVIDIANVRDAPNYRHRVLAYEMQTE
jgi:hypothetical protein